MTTEMKCRCSVKSTLKYSTTLSTHIHPAPLVAGHIPRTSTLHHPTSTLRPPLRGTSRAHPPCIPPHPPCAPRCGAHPAHIHPASPHKPRAPALAVAGRAVARPLRDAQTRLTTRPCGMGSARSVIAALCRGAAQRALLGLFVLYRSCILRPLSGWCFCSPLGGKESFLVSWFAPSAVALGCLWRSAP